MCQLLWRLCRGRETHVAVGPRTAETALRDLGPRELFLVAHAKQRRVLLFIRVASASLSKAPSCTSPAPRAGTVAARRLQRGAHLLRPVLRSQHLRVEDVRPPLPTLRVRTALDPLADGSPVPAASLDGQPELVVFFRAPLPSAESREERIRVTVVARSRVAADVARDCRV